MAPVARIMKLGIPFLTKARQDTALLIRTAIMTVSAKRHHAETSQGHVNL